MSEYTKDNGGCESVWVSVYCECVRAMSCADVQQAM